MTERKGLRDRVGHLEPSVYAEHSACHAGAGSMSFGTLLDQTALSANLLYLHRGVIPPGAGIGHHFHNTIEEMYIILDNEAEFTVDGRTSLLSGVVGAPCRMGHSHAIYNSSDRPTEWLNIGVSSRKNIGDAFDLDDDRVGVAMDPKPVFMTVRLEPGYASGDDPVRVRRALGAGVFSGPWEYLDYVILEGGSEYAVGATENDRVGDRLFHVGIGAARLGR